MNLSECLCRYRLEGLETSDLVRIMGLSRQRVYQLKAASDDRAFPKKHVRLLATASRLADLAAEFQVYAYRTRGAASDAVIEKEHGTELGHIYNEVSSSNSPACDVPSIKAMAAKAAVEEMKKHYRAVHRSGSLLDHDWHLRCYSNALGTPGFPSVGDHNGKGFFSLHNIAMQRAFEMIRNLGGAPLLTYQEDEDGSLSSRPDSTYWASVWSTITDQDIAMIDAENGVLNTQTGWKWDFEPDLDGKAYAKLA